MYDFGKIQAAIDNGATWRDLTSSFGICQGSIANAKKLGLLKTRNMSEATRLSRIKKPQRHKEETKRKLSEIRKKFLLLNPAKVPYLINHSSKQSYPEQYFSTLFEKEGLKTDREFRVGTYNIDFAIPEKKIAIEVDGEQHYVDKNIVSHDERRTEYLQSLGWTIKRIRWAKYQQLSRDKKENFVKELIASVSESSRWG